MATHDVSHFSVHADDLARARRFYETVFHWKFTPWGPPDFYLIETAGSGIHGSLQKRDEAVTGNGMIGFECTITVDDIDATRAAVLANGGKIRYDKMQIPTVGTLIQFLDTEGNVVCAMQYEPNAE